MPDTTSTATTAPEKPKATRGIINQKNLDGLDKAGLVTVAAKKADYAPLLTARDITGVFVTQLDTDIAACQARIGKAIDLTSDIRTATDAEAQAQSNLITALKEVQAAAKQKYSRTTPAQMKDYFVGEKLDTSRATLVQIADSISEKLKTDTLPGIDAAKVTALKTLRDAYTAANSGQGDVQSKATTERNGIEADVKSITDRRVQIQFAADAQWPANGNGHTAIRREFQLPTDRPFSG